MNTPCYMFYADEFIKNYHDLESTFRAVYPYYQIAYSFKTNYTPAVCRIVKELGGYAEVVSDMEYALARKIGFPAKKIFYNGPGKGGMLEECLLDGGRVHIDNAMDMKRVIAAARAHPDRQFKAAVRVNFDLDNGLLSRFGFDAENGDYQRSVDALNAVPNIHVNGLHFHMSRARSLEAWQRRIEKALHIADTAFDYPLDYLDIGSGMFGKLEPELQKQFNSPPTYGEYAGVVMEAMAKHYGDAQKKPVLFTEPGTTLVSNYFHLFTKVLDIKQIRDRNFALLDCSFHNVGEICSLKRVPIVNRGGHTGESREFDAIDLVGYTCLEQDVICPGYSGLLGVGDELEILNVGGYSIVNKPPFIHPDIPIYMLREGKVTCIKRAQTFEDIFAPYEF